MTTSHYWLYPINDVQITPELIVESIHLLDPAKELVDISRNNHPDDSWESHLQELETEEELGGCYIIPARDLIVPKCKITDAPSFFIDAKIPLTVDVGRSQPRRRIAIIDEIKMIDLSIKSDFWASNCMLTFGYHDIYQHGTDNRKPEFFARPMLSLCFWDYTFVKREIFKGPFEMLPSVANLKKAFEQLWGPVDSAVTNLFD